MSCDWEGNHRSGVALAMRHTLEWSIRLRAQGLSKGDEHAPYQHPHGVWYSLPFDGLTIRWTTEQLMADLITVVAATAAAACR